MNRKILEFIRAKKIDSIHKLNLLLFLNRNPDVQGTSQWFAEKLYLGDTWFVEKIIKELTNKGIVNQASQHYFLADNPEIKTALQHLASSFEHPLTRQTLLANIQSGGRHGIY